MKIRIKVIERERERDYGSKRDELVNEWGVSKGESFGSKFSIYISPVLGKIVIMEMALSTIENVQVQCILKNMFAFLTSSYK